MQYSFSSRVEVKNHIQMNHEEELKKAFSKEAMSLVPFHSSYLSWLQKDHIVNALSSRCCKDRNKVDLKRSNENVDDTYFKMIKIKILLMTSLRHKGQSLYHKKTALKRRKS